MNDNQRIDELKKHLKLSSNALAKALNLKSPQIFYDIKAGKCGISKDLAMKIQDKYFSVNMAWLLTGEGEMLKENVQKEKTNQQGGINIPDDVWSVIKNQSESLKDQASSLESKDKQIEDVIDMLRIKETQTSEMLDLLRELHKKSLDAAGLYRAAGLTVVEEDE